MSAARRERADAVRNRRAILSATEELLTRYRPEQVSIERIAAAAGVGKGTVFHRFGSRAGLMVALMQERATALSEAVDAGPPPLGPGAPARERLIAFVDAIFVVVGRNKGLLASLGHAITHPPTPPAGIDEIDDEVERARASHPVYRSWHGHIATLVAAMRPDLDAEMLADVVLSPLHNDVVVLALQRGESRRVAAAVRGMVTALLDAG